ncbi:saccharopine dehydrogenase family protein [Caenimonas aquaedulcis]|uniref:Saccharopine dehydrogenase NADP-binding domain-containing protein n=1 Tax=Caenimonas aquaedulcis TaxID=2793270 RepID=A0A931H5U1_9BURK|nr:saccharopine dehydrogenase NADP-binding domain-containing protein [Caenimonas aquaedulcis]MBG9389174.1 saccharopine dehydrogenase NADP-binding domain-containing protein [Caenimonas aquaedulcis]
MSGYRVLVLGGYGFFGSRLVERLARQGGLHIFAAGRSGDKARASVEGLACAPATLVEGIELDAMSGDFASSLAHLQPAAVVHCCGPFQGQDYRVAQACIAQGAHYIDLADARAFVAGISALHAAAEGARVLVTSGASSVPALSSAVVDALTRGMQSVDSIDIGISPGNRTERGLSTVRAILGYCGKRLETPSGNSAWGWGTSYRHAYGHPVGRRFLSPCDVPDLALLPGRYAGAPSVRFGAGLELPFLHLGMNAMALMARWGIVRDWSAHAALLKRIADGFRHAGSDAGAMHVEVRGRSPEGDRTTRRWELLATHGDGPYVPTLAAAALVRQLATGHPPPIGAMRCMGLLSLDDFVREANGLHIHMTDAA